MFVLKGILNLKIIPFASIRREWDETKHVQYGIYKSLKKTNVQQHGCFWGHSSTKRTKCSGQRWQPQPSPLRTPWSLKMLLPAFEVPLRVDSGRLLVHGATGNSDGRMPPVLPSQRRATAIWPVAGERSPWNRLSQPSHNLAGIIMNITLFRLEIKRGVRGRVDARQVRTKTNRPGSFGTARKLRSSVRAMNWSHREANKDGKPVKGVASVKSPQKNG